MGDADNPRTDDDGPRNKPYAPRLPPDDRREQLLDAALRIGVRRGFNEITMGNVAKACGVTRPVVYSQFRNRQDLVRALFDREVAGALTDLDDAIPHDAEAQDPRAAYLHGVRSFLTAVVLHPERWQIALSSPHGIPSEIRDLVEDQRRRVVTELEQFLLISGESSIIEPELLSLVIVGMLERLASTIITDPDRLDIDRVMNFAEMMFDPIWAAASQRAGR